MDDLNFENLKLNYYNYFNAQSLFDVFVKNADVLRF